VPPDAKDTFEGNAKKNTIKGFEKSVSPTRTGGRVWPVRISHMKRAMIFAPRGSRLSDAGGNASAANAWHGED